MQGAALTDVDAARVRKGKDLSKANRAAMAFMQKLTSKCPS